jgi:hypothetical protein
LFGYDFSYLFGGVADDYDSFFELQFAQSADDMNNHFLAADVVQRLWSS